MRFRKARTKPYDIGALIVPLGNSIPISETSHFLSRVVGFWRGDAIGTVLEFDPEERQIRILTGDMTGWISMDAVKEVDEDEDEIWGMS